MSWLYNAIHHSTKPKHSVIAVLKTRLGGPQMNRPRSVLHASDVTKEDFCPRREALLDQSDAPNGHTFVPLALDVTFQMGNVAERLLAEEWGGDHVIGNWACRLCQDTRTWVPKPEGCCVDGRRHNWAYRQVSVLAPEYGLSGSLDVLFNVGASQLVIVESKTLNPTEFESIVMPKPEHRYRTNLYMKLVDESDAPFKHQINVTEARVLYISRGYGTLNPQWNEIMPFKEFVVKRDDLDLKPLLQRAKALTVFREKTAPGYPSGICATALDKVAKKCTVCKECFSGAYPATIHVESLSV